MRLLAFTILLSATAGLQADILHLRDGSRHYGELVSQNNNVIVFRIVAADGSSALVRSFPAELVRSVEPGGRPPVTPPLPVGTAPDAGLAADCEQMLREAFELLDDDDRPAALRALQRAVLGAPPPVLEHLEQLCRAARGVALDELLARTRVEVAERTRAGRGFRLRYTTPYERAALGRVLAEMQTERLNRKYAGRTVAAWAAEPAAYTTLQPDTRALVQDASRAAAAIAARLRLDPALRGQVEERTRLEHTRGDLVRLAARLQALAGYTAPLEDDDMFDPAEEAAERLAAETAPASQPVTSDGER